MVNAITYGGAPYKGRGGISQPLGSAMEAAGSVTNFAIDNRKNPGVKDVLDVSTAKIDPKEVAIPASDSVTLTPPVTP